MSKTTELNAGMIRPKFYVARRDTRWDVCPSEEPKKVIAFDYNGYWDYAPIVGWFKTPTCYNFVREITKEEADSFLAEGGVK